jgi:AcrR family transcriptional regulator
MSRPTSKSEANRQRGAHQLDAQRNNILDAAERLFLRNGIENTRMVDIAAETGITKVTLYRYFPNRDVIAVELQVRMLNRITSLVDPDGQGSALESTRRMVQSMIRNFDASREAYRYVGMFDRLFLDNPSDAALTRWTKDKLVSLSWDGAHQIAVTHGEPHGDQLLMAVSTVIWFLQKLALRGELTWSDQAVPLQQHLSLFEDMIVTYIDSLQPAD